MHPSLFLAALCLGIASAAPQVDPNLDAQWFQWKAAHGKIYNVDEEGWRRAVWETNLKMIEQHNREYNQGKHSFTMAMNGFGDMKTNDEFRHTMNGLKIQKGSVSISNLYLGCEHLNIRSRSMMFEPGLTRGTLEVVVAPPQHPHCAADDQSTKAIDIQNAYLNGKTPMCGIPLSD